MSQEVQRYFHKHTNALVNSKKDEIWFNVLEIYWNIKWAAFYSSVGKSSQTEKKRETEKGEVIYWGVVCYSK